MQQLFRISDKHKRALRVIVENLLKNLSPAPINNLKKLPGLYSELLAVNNSTLMDPAVIHKLQGWKDAASIQKIAEKLLKS